MNVGNANIVVNAYSGRMDERTRSYHHGSLREELIREGRALVNAQGPQALTVRELARRVGVSHAAPLRHFRDRDALVDAIAADGFDELGALLEADRDLTEFEARFSAYLHAHVRFAQRNGPLMQLMFAAAGADHGAGHESSARSSAARFFALGAELLRERDPGALGPLPYLVAATTEGISALAAAGRIPPDQVGGVTDAAVRMLLPTVMQQLDAAADAAEEDA